jgi:uncharacterized protein (TIGR00369 family)
MEQVKFGVASLDTMKSMSGLDFLQAIADGRLPRPPISATLNFALVAVTKGFAVFEGTPGPEHYNPIGSVHGGIAATLLDSCMACAVQSTLAQGFGYTTLEFKISFIRGITTETGRVRAEGKVLSAGRRVGTAEGRLVDAQGRLLATGTTTCLIMQL